MKEIEPAVRAVQDVPGIARKIRAPAAVDKGAKGARQFSAVEPVMPFFQRDALNAGSAGQDVDVRLRRRLHSRGEEYRVETGIDLGVLELRVAYTPVRDTAGLQPFFHIVVPVRHHRHARRGDVKLRENEYE